MCESGRINLTQKIWVRSGLSKAKQSEVDVAVVLASGALLKVSALISKRRTGDSRNLRIDVHSESLLENIVKSTLRFGEVDSLDLFVRFGKVDQRTAKQTVSVCPPHHNERQGVSDPQGMRGQIWIAHSLLELLQRPSPGKFEELKVLDC